MAMGLQDLIMFRDNLQQPEMTGMDNLRNLQALTMQGMAAEDYMNQPQPMMMDTGLMSLPVAQAGFGGFIKSIARIPKTIAKGVSKVAKGVVKGVKNIAKSPIGQFAIPAAAMFLGPAAFGLPATLGGKAVLAGGATGLTSLVGGAKPEDALKRAILAGGLTYGGGKLFGAGGSKASGVDKAIPTDSSSYVDFARANPVSPEFAVGAEGTGLISGVPSAPSIGSVGAKNITGGLDLSGSYQDFTGGQPPEFTVGDVAADQAALKSAQPTGIIDTIRDVGGSAIKRAGEAVTSGYNKFKELGPIEKGLLLAGGATALSGLGGGPEMQAMSQYTPRQLSDADVGFDQQRAFYFDTITKKPLTISEALAKMQTAAQSFGPGGQRQSSNVSLGFEDVGDTVLSASGGLIGMAYNGMIGSQMPQNNMDVKYKEFSGMVGGRGSGMEDNVYMPIVEGEQGQQVATLAVSPKEYVVDANTMSLLGNGNPDEGAEVMDKTVKDIRKKATGQTKQQKEIDGLAALNRMRRSV